MARNEPLSEDQERHTERMQASIEREIAAFGGWISFDRYMEMALYEPGLGYYSAGALKLGPGGDFTTAPEISSLFGACIARQCAEILADLERGSILEIGAGSGRLAVDVLGRLKLEDRLPERYLILEVSADLRQRQRELLAAELPGLLDRIQWLDEPPQEPFEGVIVANEVLDALPVTRFRWRGTACDEVGVSCVEGAFEWSVRPASAALSGAVQVLVHDWEPGYVSEYCPRMGAWVRSVASCLRRGAALWFDYGLPRPQYYLAERHGGTLISHFNHRALDDPFRYPGLQDITAWVDFTALAECCLDLGCDLAGFTTQAFFLAGLGIDHEMRRLAAADENRFARLANQARRLMLPGEMGERFKAMAWTRDLDRELSGFALQDLRHSL